VLQFPFIGIDHAERVFLAAAVQARYAGRPDAAWLEPAIRLLPAGARRRAQILGRAILLGYRLSGSVPEILANARIDIRADRVLLEVARAARVPDSEVVGDRLKLLAQAVGVRRVEIVEPA
jgi:exopolyphosphatase/guanosine-5'-triphosphate,3'-diphosphate pyrophosphatase